MPLLVVSCYTYRTSGNEFGVWTDEHYSVNKYVDAIKGDPVNLYGHVLVNGTLPKRRIEQANAAASFDWFGEMGARVLGEAGLNGVVLVPVPNKACTVGTPASRTRALADAVRQHSSAVRFVSDVLRWRQVLPSAHRGGTRDPSVLLRNLVVNQVPIQGPCVLIDDILTTGGHLRACAAALATVGCPVEMAICAAKSDEIPQVNPFQDRTDEYPDFQP